MLEQIRDYAETKNPAPARGRAGFVMWLKVSL